MRIADADADAVAGAVADADAGSPGRGRGCGAGRRVARDDQETRQDERRARAAASGDVGRSRRATHARIGRANWSGHGHERGRQRRRAVESFATDAAPARLARGDVLYLVDFSGYVFRARALTRSLRSTTQKGEPTHADLRVRADAQQDGRGSEAAITSASAIDAPGPCDDARRWTSATKQIGRRPPTILIPSSSSGSRRSLSRLTSIPIFGEPGIEADRSDRFRHRR